MVEKKGSGISHVQTHRPAQVDGCAGGPGFVGLLGTLDGHGPGLPVRRGVPEPRPGNRSDRVSGFRGFGVSGGFPGFRTWLPLPVKDAGIPFKPRHRFLVRP